MVSRTSVADRHDNPGVADGTARMVFLGFGKYARADKIYALEPIRGKDQGGGKRTLVWVDGVAEPIVAGRTKADDSPRDEASSPPARSSWTTRWPSPSASPRTPTRAASTSPTSAGAPKLLEASAKPSESEQLF